MSLKTQIDADIKAAMLAKNQDDLRALRAIKSMILLAQSETTAGTELKEEEETKILMKAAKQRKDSIEVFKQQGREDLADSEIVELKVIERYLPEMMSEEELTKILKALVEEKGATGPQDMGKLMPHAIQAVSGKADNKSISSILKTLLQA